MLDRLEPRRSVDARFCGRNGDWHRLDSTADACDKGLRFGDECLHGRQGERSFVAGGVVPDLSDPERVGVRRIGGDHVTETAGHRLGGVDEH